MWFHKQQKHELWLRLSGGQQAQNKQKHDSTYKIKQQQCVNRWLCISSHTITGTVITYNKCYKHFTVHDCWWKPTAQICITSIQIPWWHLLTLAMSVCPLHSSWNKPCIRNAHRTKWKSTYTQVYPDTPRLKGWNASHIRPHKVNFLFLVLQVT